MGTHKELVTGLIFDKSFKRLLLNYYIYGFKANSELDRTDSDWERLHNILNERNENKYITWSKSHSRVKYISADSQSMKKILFTGSIGSAFTRTLTLQGFCIL